MSVLKLSAQTQQRLPKIKIGLLSRQTREQIGQDCRVTERTIRRDLKAWVKTPDYDEWLEILWLTVLQEVYPDNKLEVFKEVSRLKAKRITQRIESKHVEEITEKIKVDINMYNDAEKSILDKAARLLDRKSQRKPSSIH